MAVEDSVEYVPQLEVISREISVQSFEVNAKGSRVVSEFTKYVAPAKFWPCGRRACMRGTEGGALGGRGGRQ